MTQQFWDGLNDEELSLQSDQWRYAMERAHREQKWALAAWCRRTMISADSELYERALARAAATYQGRQLALEIPQHGRLEPGDAA